MEKEAREPSDMDYGNNMDIQVLPPLPEPRAWMVEWPQHAPSFTCDKSDYVMWHLGKASYPDRMQDLFTAEQMREYAAAALASPVSPALAEPDVTQRCAWEPGGRPQDGCPRCHFEHGCDGQAQPPDEAMQDQIDDAVLDAILSANLNPRLCVVHSADLIALGRAVWARATNCATAPASISTSPERQAASGMTMLTPAEHFAIGLVGPVRIADIEAIQRAFAAKNGAQIKE